MSISSIDIGSYNLAGQVFSAANVSSKNVIAVTTAMTGVILYNPMGSNVKAIIWDVGFAWVTAPAAVHNLAIALAPPNATVPSSLTAIGSGVLQSNGSGNAGNAVCKAYDTATLPVAPVIQRWIGGAVYGSGVGESPYQILDSTHGAIVLIPGAVMALAAVTTTLAGMGHVTWIEVPANN